MYEEYNRPRHQARIEKQSNLSLILILILLIALFPQQTFSQQELTEGVTQEETVDEGDLDDLSELSLEDLLDMEVTSVAKSSQPLSKSPAAVFVITQEDIQRAGARSIPEALRLAPGIEVAQINRHRWAVSARGFNNVFASKMLVLMDGRTLYTPLFSGTFWNQQSTPVENIERIEVIRGPGATLWGTNAVNGIINIITKRAEDAQGGRIKTILGTNNKETYIRYGAQVGEEAYLKVYGQFFDRDDFVDSQGDETHSDWDMYQLGFRLDMMLSEWDSLTVQGDAYNGHADQSVVIPDFMSATLQGLLEDTIDIAGTNMIATWNRKIDDNQEFTLRAFVDRTERTDDLFKDVRSTFDIEFQHKFLLGESHNIIWGVGYRYITDDFEGTLTVSADPDARRYQIFNAFVQDEISIIDDELRLIVGSKFSHNDFSGFEVQPSLRMIWTPEDTHTVWAAVSRAVEIPTRGSQDVDIFISPVQTMAGPLLPVVQGSKNADSVDLLAFELGYRVRPFDNMSFDIAMFYNEYKNLNTDEIRGLGMFNGLPVLSIISDNRANADSYGFEISAEWLPTSNLRLSMSYSFISINVDPGDSADPNIEDWEGDSPDHRIIARAHWDITDNLEFNTSLYWVDNIRTSNIPSYVRVDLQLRWQITDNLEFAAGVRNLLDDRHPEFEDFPGRLETEIERTAYFWLDFTF